MRTAPPLCPLKWYAELGREGHDVTRKRVEAKVFGPPRRYLGDDSEWRSGEEVRQMNETR